MDYLRAIFGTNIRAVVPELAMSAGTMIACACKQIVMGKQSSLGPIDPQTFVPIPGNDKARQVSTHGIIDEFEKAREDIISDPRTVPLWQPIISQYNPTLVGQCQNTIKWTEDMVSTWLQTGMFRGAKNVKERVKRVMMGLGRPVITKTHDRHLTFQDCKNFGLNVMQMESDQALQEAILSLHHSCIHTISRTMANKIIENHEGKAYIKQWVPNAQQQQSQI